MVKVYKKEKESSQQVLRRFSKIIKRSGILRDVREKKYYQKPKSGQLQKRSALKKKELREEYNRLKKLGELDRN